MLEGHTYLVTSWFRAQWVMSVAWSSDGDIIASGSRDETVRVWQVNVQVRGVSAYVICALFWGLLVLTSFEIFLLCTTPHRFLPASVRFIVLTHT